MRLTFVGDIALGDHPKAVGFGFRSRYPAGIHTALARRLRPPGPAPDFFFGNLEFSLGFQTGRTGLSELACRGCDEYVAYLVGEGLSALNVANNHTTQHGRPAFDTTVALLRASGIHVIGTPTDFTEQGVLVVGGQRLALLGWCDRPRQYASETPPYNEFSDLAYGQITEAKRRADLVIVSMHWGDEFILVPSDRERVIARRMVEAGASFVIGHHPHVLREVEEYRGGIVAYSLGNFVCDMTWDVRTRVSGWLSAEVEAGHIVSSELIPALIDEDYLPRPLGMGDRPTFDSLARERRVQIELINRKSYVTLVEAERRRHARRTAWQMLRNWHRYPRGVAVEVFWGALGHRLAGLLGGIAGRRNRRRK